MLMSRVLRDDLGVVDPWLHNHKLRKCLSQTFRLDSITFDSEPKNVNIVFYCTYFLYLQIIKIIVTNKI